MAVNSVDMLVHWSVVAMVVKWECWKAATMVELMVPSKAVSWVDSTEQLSAAMTAVLWVDEKVGKTAV